VSEPIDPDTALDYSDLPATCASPDPAVRALLRWARRQHASRRELRAWALGALLTLLGAAGSVVWGASALNTEVASVREDVADVRAAIERIEERQWSGVRTTHTEAVP